MRIHSLFQLHWLAGNFYGDYISLLDLLQKNFLLLVTNQRFFVFAESIKSIIDDSCGVSSWQLGILSSTQGRRETIYPTYIVLVVRLGSRQHVSPNTCASVNYDHMEYPVSHVYRCLRFFEILRIDNEDLYKLPYVWGTSGLQTSPHLQTQPETCTVPSSSLISNTSTHWCMWASSGIRRSTTAGRITGG